MQFEKLSNLCMIQIGKTPSRQVKRYWGNGFPWVAISDLKKKYICETKEQITQIAINETNCKVIPKGTLLMSFKLSIGKLAFSKCDLFTNEAIAGIIIKNKEILNKNYLYYALKNIPLLKGVKVAVKGNTLNKKSLGNLQIPLVKSLDEQIKIANLLTQVEELIAKRKESIQLLDKLLQSTFLDMFGDPNQFQYKPIEEIASNEDYSLSSGPFGSNLTSKHYTSEGVIILRGKNITSGKIDLSDIKFISEEKAIELKRSEIKPDDIVIIAVGSSGYALRIPETLPRAIISQNFNKVTPNTNIVLPIYLEYIINSEIVQTQFRKVIVNGGRSFLSLRNIKKIKIPCPPKVLQSKFATIVKQVETTKEKYQNSLNELNQLFGSLSQKAFKGELDLSKMELPQKQDESLQKMIDSQKAYDKALETKVYESNLTNIETVSIQSIPKENLETYIFDLIKLNTFAIENIQHLFETDFTYNDVKEKIFEMLEDGKIRQNFKEDYKEKKYNYKIELVVK